MTKVLLVVLCLLAASTMVFAVCSTTTVNCFSQVIGAAETCADSPANCPKRAACTTSAAPYRCADDFCAATPQACVNRLRNKGVICRPTDFTCWDGGCYSDASLCPFIPPCPTAFDIRCVDMTCRQSCAGVPPKNIVFADPSNAPIFCDKIPGYLCYNNAGCFMGDTQCPDGTCAVNRTQCQTGPSNNAGGKANWGGCNDTQVRCFGARYGTCNATAADCPAVPSRGIVLPFAGTIGPLAVNFTLVSEAQNGPEIGYVAIPAFLDASSAPLNMIVNSQFGGDLLYPFNGVASPEYGQKLIGMQEETIPKETFWRSDPEFPPLDSPSQSILSPIVKMSCPQLHEIFVVQVQTLSPALRAEAQKLLDQKWNMNITMYATPPKVGCKAPICLAEAAEKNNSTVKVWQCIDSNPVEIAPGLWSGLVPVVDLAVQTHFAFIADYRRSRCEFPRMETIGGGLLAFGAIAFVVIGIIILANREKLFTLIQTSVFKTSG